MKNGINKSHLILTTKICFLFTFIQILFLLDEILLVQYIYSDKVRVKNCSLSLGLLNTEHKNSIKKAVDQAGQ